MRSLRAVFHNPGRPGRRARACPDRRSGHAQGVPPGANPATGARPGNDIGTGMSLPMGTRASNIDAADTRSVIAPNLPSPPLDRNASAADFLRAAQTALQANRTGGTVGLQHRSAPRGR